MREREEQIIHIYIYKCIHLHTHAYIYTYVEGREEAEREREQAGRERERAREATGVVERVDLAFQSVREHLLPLLSRPGEKPKRGSVLASPINQPP
jgi:hypothetical protein